MNSIDLSLLHWTLAGYTPTSWAIGKTLELVFDVLPEIPAMAATVPGSVGNCLRQHKLIPDWNVGLNSRLGEWAENRDWVFAVNVTPDPGNYVLDCESLDGNGIVLFDGKKIGRFDNSFVCHSFRLPPVSGHREHTLELVFLSPPRWLGTPHQSSAIRDFKPRFYYTWDWMPRIVQTGIAGDIRLRPQNTVDLADTVAVGDFDVQTNRGSLLLQLPAARQRHRYQVAITNIFEREISGDLLKTGVHIRDLAVKPWFPNLAGEPLLYELSIRLIGTDGQIISSHQQSIGFKHIRWLNNQNSPGNAEPWICEINGKKIFLAGVNWTPIRPNYADLKRADYEKLLLTYRQIGFNCLRVWGGAALESRDFYELCDQYGFLVWQEFPLSSSGPDNEPPAGRQYQKKLCRTAKDYIRRRKSHVSLLLWCGGNELQTKPDGTRGCGKPLDCRHPTLKALAETVKRHDPNHRFIPCSSSGPRFVADQADFGKGLHHDVHGPWRLPGEDFAVGSEYWEHDDALFRSECGAPGASSVEIFDRYCGGLTPLPITETNPLWRRFYWWIDRQSFVRQFHREPDDLAFYVNWSQQRQADALQMALQSAVARFPSISGMLFWMGHDSFPCPANTSLVDFDGNVKPAATAIQTILRGERQWITATGAD